MKDAMDFLVGGQIMNAEEPATGFNVVALVVEALDRGPDASPGIVPRASAAKMMSRGNLESVAECTPTRASSVALAVPDRRTMVDSLSSLPRRRRRREDTPTPSPRRFDFSSSSFFSSSSSSSQSSSSTSSPPSHTSSYYPSQPFPSAEPLCLPDAVVEVIIDYLPAPQALSMVIRSRARERASTCSKYALSRLDKMVTGLARAEDAFHHARRKAKKSKDAEAAARKKTAAEKKQDPKGTPSPVRKKRTRFSQLGDLASLDLIYKKALHTAHVSNGVCLAQPINAGSGNRVGGSAEDSPYTVWSQEHQCGSGPTWAKTGLASTRVWGIGRRLMGLLATGMVSNLSKRVGGRVDDRTIEVGIVTDCMHPTTAGNRRFQFKDSLDICGLFGFDRFPLVVIPGMCVLNTESPIFACLPRAEGKPIVLVPDSDGTEAGSGGGSSGNRTTEINHGGREWSGSPWLNAHSDDLSVGGVSAAPSAVVARTYKSNCGRYMAALVRFCAPSSGIGDDLTAPEWHQEIRNQVAHLSRGLGPCKSQFCRTWHVPLYTLVVFGTSPILQDPLIFRRNDGVWMFASDRCQERIFREWSRLLGTRT